ncbi:unnamed protein product [Thlaspi arvense]|uniref:Nodulin-like domain-containing protein n=1 Tax=Thlaspi arvense TaxID=13288 RepID=A0AAU9S8C2_THLAR|nr:unnamed protein product [Thlaspi arvense]
MVTLKLGTRPPWLGLGAAVWLQIASGNGYNFPLYSHSLKSVLGFNQRQVTMLGVANDIGENIGILPGIVCNKFPPWVVLIFGAVACFLGYGVLWLAVSQTVQSLPYWVLWLALCLATNSSAWIGTAVLVTNMRNFPLSRGTVAGILKGYGGLSAAVYTEVFGVLLQNSSPKFLMFLTVGIPLGILDTKQPLLEPSPSTSNLGSFHESDSALDLDMLLAVGEGAVKKKRRPRRGEDFKFGEAFIKADFWLLFLVYFAGVGTGVTVLNNLAQIGIAQGTHDTTILLSLFSFCNFVGRLGGGAVSEHFVRSKTIPRTMWMTITQVVMVITYLLFASAIDGTLYVATAILESAMVPNPLPWLTFLVLAGVCTIGTVLSIVLTKRIKPVYEMLYAGGSFRLPQSSGH